jgi:hypothetical protein
VNIATFAILVLLAAGVMLLAPLVSRRSAPAPAVAFLYLVQLIPAVLAIAYFQYAETHMRIPFYSYSRPSFVVVLGSLLVLQCMVTWLVLSRLSLRGVRKVAYTALSGLAAIGIAFVGSGVVACVNGNCF